MSWDTALASYVGFGLAASRPASGNPAPNSFEFYFAYDTSTLSLWNSNTAAWDTVGGGGTTTIASGTAALGTAAIASGTKATTVTVAATGVATTDALIWGFNSDPTGVTGYVPGTGGMLTIIAFPTAGNVNFIVVNNTAASITPGAITLNWRVVR